MSRIKQLVLVVLALAVALVVFVFVGVFLKRPAEVIWSEASLEEYMERLERDPNNCHLTQQIAAIHQSALRLEGAITYYSRTIRNCPNDFVSKFQLGVSYYLKNDEAQGIRYMDEAISDTVAVGDEEAERILRDEKMSLLRRRGPKV